MMTRRRNAVLIGASAINQPMDGDEVPSAQPKVLEQPPADQASPTDQAQAAPQFDQAGINAALLYILLVIHRLTHRPVTHIEGEEENS